MLLATMALALSPAELISPADPRIAYVGRFDLSDPKRAVCEWSACSVRLRFKGKELKVTFADTGDDYIQVAQDGESTQVLHATQGAQTVSLAFKETGDHLVELVKRTEPFVGTLTYQGFETPDGELLKAPHKTRHLQFVGDSITCGYGSEGANQNEKFKPATEDAYLSYGSVAARALDADLEVVAWSGRKMWPNETVPELYDRVLPTRQQPTYDFGGPAPAAVVINLATNDFNETNPEENVWTAAYEAFIRRVWGHYPKARIYVAIGPMMSDNWPPNHKALTTLRAYLQRLVDRMHDDRLSLIEFPTQDSNDGLGADWHPSVKTHRKMGSQLADAIAKDLGWHRS